MTGQELLAHMKAMLGEEQWPTVSAVQPLIAALDGCVLLAELEAEQLRETLRWADQCQGERGERNGVCDDCHAELQRALALLGGKP